MPVMELVNRATVLNDRPQSNENFTLLASAARTADTASALQVNPGAGGVTIYLDVTEAEAETLTIYLQTPDPVSGTIVSLTNSGALSISAVGAQVWQPAVPLPRDWRINADKSGAGSATFSIAGCYTRTHP